MPAADPQFRLYVVRCVSLLAITGGAMRELLATDRSAVTSSRLRAWAARIARVALRLERMADLVDGEPSGSQGPGHNP